MRGLCKWRWCWLGLCGGVDFLDGLLVGVKMSVLFVVAAFEVGEVVGVEGDGLFLSSVVSCYLVYVNT